MPTLRIPPPLIATALACAASASLSATADRLRLPTASLQKPRIGVQVKIQSFTADDARRIRQTGFDLVRFGVWTDRLDRDDYRRQVDEAFTAAR
ncbi:hypothetical protein G3N96_09975 [Burkholderia sp. Se-20373]|nr:hypothetical protein [Burkholderia sp. Se-20373]